MSSQISAEDRPIALRRRPDIVEQESVYQKQLCWIVKDPVALKYYRLLEPEYVIWKQLNGKNSYRDIKQTVDRRFPEFTTRYEDLQNLISSFHQNGLVLGDAPGQAEPLLKRAKKEKRQKVIKAFSSILFMRLPGIDPVRFLSWLHPKVKWFFTPLCTTICFGLMASALLLVLLNLDEFYRRLPEFQRFFSAQNFVMMAFVLMGTKVVHELGHGISCKHFGGECHAIGFMLLVLTPAMYCDTSDSWVLRNKWHRAAIGAFGMYVEVVMASICTFIWWYTQPGFLNYLCLNVVFVSSVSTIVFNANPLLRYDGYYILSDILEIPNLSQKAQMALLSKTRTLCLGMDPIRSRLMPQTNQWIFAIFSVASFLYRWFVLIFILWFLTKLFEPWGLEVLGHLFISISLFGLVIMPMYKLIKFFLYPGRFRQVKRVRFAITVICVLALIAMIAYVPLPHRVAATVVIEPLDADSIYVKKSSTLEEIFVEPGQRVVAGMQLARLDDTEMRLEIANTKSEISQLQFEIQALRSTTLGVTMGQQIKRAKTELTNKKQKLALLEEQEQDLILKAQHAGTIIPPDFLPAKPMPEKMLASWNGTPLDPKNRGALLEEQTLFCYVGDPQKMKAKLVIDQSDIAQVKIGDQVEIMLEEYPGMRIEGKIDEIAERDMSQIPRELSQSFGGPMATRPNAAGSEQTMFVSYFASVHLEGVDAKLLPGFRGQAKVRVSDSNLGSWINRQFWKVFYFR